ncbi:MAG: outer membrane protein assembly factor BamD [Pseudomonadota bacterium]
MNKSFSKIFTARMVKQTLSTLVLCFVFLTGCNSKPEVSPELSEETYFRNAQEAIADENFIYAIEQLKEIESRFPFGVYAPQAHLDLIYAYYESEDYDNARVSADRFTKLYGSHEKVDYAYYMRALSAYDVDRGFLARVLPSSPAERDLKPVYDAYTLFNRFILDYPKSMYVADARQRLKYITNLLAEHELIVAQYYIKRQAYLAAANRARYVLENFPNSPEVPKAIAYLAVSYRFMEMEDLAVEAETRLTKAFPESAKLYAQGNLIPLDELENEQKNLTETFTFGLMGKSKE